MTLLAGRRTLLAGLLAIVTGVAAPAYAGTLLGTGTLNTTDDLTRIQDGSNVLDFLDLTATNGSSVSVALSVYGPQGFHWANGAEVSSLFSAFGIGYAVTPHAITTLSHSDVATFVTYLGDTYAPTVASVGWLDDLTNDPFHTYACIGPGCNPGSGPIGAFTSNINEMWPAYPHIGVYLVRSEGGASPIPEPASVSLLALGLAALGFRRRKKA